MTTRPPKRQTDLPPETRERIAAARREMSSRKVAQALGVTPMQAWYWGLPEGRREQLLERNRGWRP